jgi:hypothetical protein
VGVSAARGPGAAGCVRGPAPEPGPHWPKALLSSICREDLLRLGLSTYGRRALGEGGGMGRPELAYCSEGVAHAIGAPSLVLPDPLVSSTLARAWPPIPGSTSSRPHSTSWTRRGNGLPWGAGCPAWRGCHGRKAFRPTPRAWAWPLERAAPLVRLEFSSRTDAVQKR